MLRRLPPVLPLFSASAGSFRKLQSCSHAGQAPGSGNRNTATRQMLQQVAGPALPSPVEMAHLMLIRSSYVRTGRVAQPLPFLAQKGLTPRATRQVGDWQFSHETKGHAPLNPVYSFLQFPCLNSAVIS